MSGRENHREDLGRKHCLEGWQGVNETWERRAKAEAELVHFEPPQGSAALLVLEGLGTLTSASLTCVLGGVGLDLVKD